MTTVPTRLAVAVDDPARDDVQRLVQVHRDWSLRQTPREFSFSVEPQAVAEAGITLFSVRSFGGELLGIAGVSLETGTGESFRPARSLYESFGFRPSEPFGDYVNTEHNLCIALRLPDHHGRIGQSPTQRSRK